MKNIIVALGLIWSVSTQAQDVVGYWYGNANIKNGGSANNYLVELILKQSVIERTNIGDEPLLTVVIYCELMAFGTQVKS